MFTPNDHDRRAELRRQMDEIKKREGLAGDDDWFIGEGPEDYQALSRESDALYDKVRETVFVHVLRRYHLDDVADFFEQNRDEYTKLVADGRTSVFGALP